MAGCSKQVDESKIPARPRATQERGERLGKRGGTGRSADQAAPKPNPPSGKEGLVGRFLWGLSVTRQGDSRLLNLALEASDPTVARDLLRTYIEVFIEESVNKRRKASAEAGAWLKAELERAKKKLVDSLRAL
jgi:uncharacterized protein involved in exopolysaccharide biosynthesis